MNKDKDLTNYINSHDTSTLLIAMFLTLMVLIFIVRECDHEEII